MNLTIATRYSRCGRKISEQFKNRLEIIVSKAKILNLQEYGFLQIGQKMIYMKRGKYILKISDKKLFQTKVSTKDNIVS